MTYRPMARTYPLIEESLWTHKAVIVDEKGYDISRGYLLMMERPDKGGRVGLIEDIWTHPDHRKKGLASEVIQTLIEVAQDHKCYKIVLACSDDNMPLYQKFGFYQWQNSMRKDLH